ncbi:hypothetical protein E2562_022256 [Oryza meyeriana var. granulata]|uniref:Non-haem dioxygenase N-terminal domain-containing protein n=1 Tax=Oryza meyeriana var. granulata TaxID=110450 RepID=A0A6G1D6B0_9ORYZ|nr:hypothetical protein E2562_022256 [Oryza meyeriana var. granulata]
MDSMLHLTPSHASLPSGFAVPADDRLQPAINSAAVALPVIDLSGSRDEVVNHGISEQTLRDMEVVCDEFFQLPAADKKHLYSDDKSKPNRLFSGSTYKSSSTMYWMDCLRLTRNFPTADSISNWPDKPQMLRVEHRAVTNTAVPRTSVVTTLHAAEESLLSPAEELLSDSNPPSYRTITCRDFMRIYNQSLQQHADEDTPMEHHMKPFRI